MPPTCTVKKHIDMCAYEPIMNQLWQLYWKLFQATCHIQLLAVVQECVSVRYESLYHQCNPECRCSSSICLERQECYVMLVSYYQILLGDKNTVISVVVKGLIWNRFANMWCLESINHRSYKFKMWEHSTVLGQSISVSKGLSVKDCWLKIVLIFIAGPIRRRFDDVLMKTFGRFDYLVACTKTQSGFLTHASTWQLENT